MALTSGFFNAVKQSDGTYDRMYSADQMNDLFEGLISDGVYENVDSALQVVAGEGMKIRILPGRGFLERKWFRLDSAQEITINTANVTLNRYTAVIIRLDYAQRTIGIITRDGANATNPIKPAVENTATVKELCLAYVYVGRGVTTITQANITDMRASDLCGWVTGVVKQVDTSQLFLQWQTAYEEYFADMEQWKAEQKTGFETWLNTLTEELNVNTYVERYTNKFTTSAATQTFAIGVSQYESGDLVDVYINNLHLEPDEYAISNNTVTLTNLVNSGQDIEVVVTKSKIGIKS